MPAIQELNLPVPGKPGQKLVDDLAEGTLGTEYLHFIGCLSGKSVIACGRS